MSIFLLAFIVNSSSVVKFGDFVVVRSLDALCIVSVKLCQARQGLNTIGVGLETWLLYKELTFCNPVHEVAKLKEDEVDIGDVIAAQVRLFSQEIDKRSDLCHDTLSDGLSVTLRVTRHRRGTFQIRDDL